MLFSNAAVNQLSRVNLGLGLVSWSVLVLVLVSFSDITAHNILVCAAVFTAAIASCILNTSIRSLRSLSVSKVVSHSNRNLS